MRAAKLEPNATLSYSAVTSACGKGMQWRRALALHSEMLQAKLDSHVVSCNAVISACEKGEQWQWALALLSEMWEAKLEPDSATAPRSARARKVGSGRGLCRCSARCGRRSSIQTSSATALASARARRAGNGSGLWRSLARCGRQSWSLQQSSKLQRCHQRVREGPAVAVGSGTAKRDGDKVGARHDFSYSAVISACEKGRQWQRALALLGEMREAKVEPNSPTPLLSARAKRASSGSGLFGCLVRCGTRTWSPTSPLSYSACISACENSNQWKQALLLLSEIEAKL
ncbi:unnamed protein product [Prorocentrum cordatum]|uniref:Pentatricopeptide repeat-containing protein, chloroplastic n=1 Tax=Prorocentrum cordatum TaxID=2364126 RepID=A0ABN9VNQ9_9DINO|nr:unnamed protein product [Polarella glacialis]